MSLKVKKSMTFKGSTASRDSLENVSTGNTKHSFFFSFTSLEVHQHTVSLPKGHHFINYAFHNRRKELFNWDISGSGFAQLSSVTAREKKNMARISKLSIP